MHVKIQALACRQGKNNSPLVLTACVEHAVMIAVGGARTEGNAVTHYLCMYPYSPFYDPIHAQIARLYSCVNQIGGGSGCDIVYLTKAQRVSYHGN